MDEPPYELVSKPDGPIARIRARGNDVLRTPILNRGTAFTRDERRALGLVGLLPTGVSSMEAQVRRTYAQYRWQPDALAKHLYLASLRDRNEVLFYRLLADHLEEMLPIVYTPTIGEVIERFSNDYNRPRGVFLSIDHPEDIEDSLANYGLGADDCDLIVATDSEGILGIGDQGVGGIQISIGKLTVYTAAGGIHPRRVIPVVLDVGTDNLRLLNDELYLGERHARVRGERYDEFIDAYVSAATKLFPTPCCTGRTSAPATRAVSWTGMPGAAAPSTTTCRAPPRWCSRRSSPPFAPAGRDCATSGWSSSAPGRRAWASPT